VSETLAAALRRGAAALAEAGVPDPARDARALLEWAAGLSAAGLTAAQSDPLDAEGEARFANALAQRRSRKPVSQITGRRLFWGLDFEVTADVLDPRPESETLIAAAADGPAPRTILDLGVGSACLLAAALTIFPGARGLGVDASEDALSVAARNLDRLGLKDRARLRRGDWLSGVTGRFDLILCNPPYIAADEMAGLSLDVRGFEPHLALTPGGDGLAPYRRIAPQLAAALAPGGRAIFEIGARQAASATAIFVAAGFEAPEILSDFDGRDRALMLRAAA